MKQTEWSVEIIALGIFLHRGNHLEQLLDQRTKRNISQGSENYGANKNTNRKPKTNEKIHNHKKY